MSKLKRRVAFAMALTMMWTSLPVNGLIGYAEEYPEETTDMIVSEEDTVKDEASDESVFTEDEELIAEEVSTDAEEEQIMDESPLETYSEEKVENALALSEGTGVEIVNRPDEYMYAKWGENVTLEVVATANPGVKLTYQWQVARVYGEDWEKTYENIEGATDSTYTVENAAYTKRYRCIVNDGNEDYPVDTLLMVQSIETNEVSENLKVEYGTDATLTVDAVSHFNSATLSYKWKKRKADGSGYEEVQNGTSNTFLASNITGPEEYDCWISDGNYETSVTFHISVDTGVTFTDEHISFFAKCGDSVRMDATATANEGIELSYQWKRWDLDQQDYVDIADVESSVYEITAGERSEQYYCIVTDNLGQTYERYFHITITTLTIDDEMWDRKIVVPYNGKTTLSVSASSTLGEDKLRYQWKKLIDAENCEYEDMKNGNSSMLEIENIVRHEQYICEISDTNNSSTVYFDISVDAGVKFKETQTDFEAVYGSNVTMDATATTANENVTLSYQWYKVDSYDEMIDGANEPIYKVTVIGDEEYYCIVTDNYGNTYEKWFSIYLDTSIEITDRSESMVYVNLGDDVTLYVKATTNYEPLTYQWQIYDENAGEYKDIDGATSDTYVVKDVQKIASYKCQIENKRSYKEATFRVRIDSDFFVDEEVNTINVEKGEKAVLSVDARSNYPLQYQWYKYREEEDDILLEGQNAASYEIPSVEENESYLCKVSDGYNSGEVLFEVRINSGFSISVKEKHVWVPEGSDATLEVEATTKEEYGPLEYQWSVLNYESDTWSVIEGAADAAYTVKEVTDIQKYRCKVSNKLDFGEIEFIVGPEGYKEEYALDFASAKEFIEEEANEIEFPFENAEVYFKFTPSQTGIWRIYSESDLDPAVELYDANQECIDEDDDGGDEYNFSLECSLRQGKTYYLKCRYLDAYTENLIVKAEYVGKDDSEHNWDEGTVTQEPTCVEKGIKTYVCMDCGESYTEDIPALGHDYPENWTIRKEATCTEDGVEYRICSRDSMEETQVIPATGHTFGEVIEKEATETENGRKYQICEKCKTEKILEVIPATGIKSDVEAAKTAVGKLDNEDATAADIVNAVDAITKIDNQLMADIDAADETSNLTALVSTVEEKLIGKSTEETGIAAIIKKNSVAEGAGMVSEGVSVTGAAVTVASLIKNNKIEVSDGATYQAQLKIEEANSTEDGVYNVDISMNILKEGETTPVKENVQPETPIRITMPIPEKFRNAQFDLKHNGTNVPYTISEDGTCITFCAVSFSPWELQITKCAEGQHQYVEATTDPAWKNATHTEAGYKVEICSICNDRKESTVPTTPHKWSDWTDETEATCEENGTQERHCTIGGCDEKETRLTAKLGHKKSWIVDQEPTCGEEGKGHYKCSVCYEEFGEETIPATDDHIMAKVVDQEATCVTDGKGHYECTVCHTRGRDFTIKASGSHNMQLVVDQQPTCGVAGSQHQECSICHFKEEATTIPATGAHSFGNYQVTVQPTVFATGVKTRTCSVCGHKENAEIAKLTANVTLSASSLPLQIKQSVSLTKLITAITEGDRLVSCTTSNKKIVTVNNTGKVTGKKAGNAKITMNFASGITKTVTVKVQKKKVTTSKITIAPGSITLKVKKTYKLSPVIAPITSKDKVTYKTANKKIATVSGKGVISAKKAGKTTITIKVGKKTKKVKVTITK